MRFTVFGGEGFVGRHLCARLRAEGHAVTVPPRDAVAQASGEAGHVIYAIGLTGDFRERPFETVEAHLCLLARLLRRLRYDSWLYLSSTRIYGGLDPAVPVAEETPLRAVPSPDGLYDLSKLLGESLCLSLESPRVRVARLANVYGAGQSRHGFLGSLLAELREKGSVTFREGPDSAKDYIAAGEVARLLAAIAAGGRHRLYNVASGRATRHAELAEALRHHSGAPMSFAAGAPTRAFPPADVSRITEEFGLAGGSLLDDLLGLLEGCRETQRP